MEAKFVLLSKIAVATNAGYIFLEILIFYGVILRKVERQKVIDELAELRREKSDLY